MSTTPPGRDEEFPPPVARMPHGRARVFGGSILELAGRPALGEVRRWTTGVLPPLDPDLVDDVLLVANELVANAYDHTAVPVRLRVLVTDGQVRIEVQDGSSAPPVPPGPDASGTRGRGLLLVKKLASAWGATLGPVGKTVWAHLTHTASTPSRDQRSPVPRGSRTTTG